MHEYDEFLAQDWGDRWDSLSDPDQEIFETQNIDKYNWPPGPWQNEIDKMSWVHAELECLIVRDAELGYLCGYVGVPEHHPCYGLRHLEVQVEISYAGPSRGTICPIPLPRGRLWWFGFDEALSRRYRGVPYVAAKCQLLASQIAAL